MIVFFFNVTLHCNSKSFCQELWPLLAWLKGLLNTGFSQMSSAPLQGARSCPKPVRTDQVGGGSEVVQFFPLLLLHVLQAGQKELLACEQVRCTLEKADRRGCVKTECHGTWQGISQCFLDLCKPGPWQSWQVVVVSYNSMNYIVHYPVSKSWLYYSGMEIPTQGVF